MGDWAEFYLRGLGVFLAACLGIAFAGGAGCAFLELKGCPGVHVSIGGSP